MKKVGLEQHEIPLSEATGRAQMYVNSMASVIYTYNNIRKDDMPILSSNFVKAFWIPKDDIDRLVVLMDELKEAGAVKNFNGYRLYLGMVEDTSNDEGGYKISVTVNATETVNPTGNPEDEYERDIILKDPVVIEQETAESGVFDFTRPCPTFCDPDSPLNIRNPLLVKK